MGLTQVSKDGVKNDAIDASKLPANSVGASELADNAVDTNAIANDAVTVSKIQNVSQDRILGRQSSGSGDLQELNADNVRLMLNVADGANQTTINNNADNRLITGSNTANTLEGETNLTYDGTDLTLGAGRAKLTDESSGAQLSIGAAGDFQIEHDASNTYLANNTGDLVLQNDANVKITAKAGGTQRFRFDSDGLKFGTDTATANALDDYEEGQHQPTITGSTAGTISIHSNENKLSYQKVGNTVHLHGRLRLDAISGDFSGTLQLSLPYAALSHDNTDNLGMSAVGTHGVILSESTDIGLFLETNSNSSIAYFVLTKYGGSAWSGATAGSFGGAGNDSNDYLTFNHTYKTSS